MSIKSRIFAIVCGIALSDMCWANERVWTDTSGKYTVTGTLVREKDGQVHIRLTDGRLVAIDTPQLSKNDSQFIRNAGRGSSTGSTRAEGVQPPESAPAVDVAVRKPDADSKESGVRSDTAGADDVLADGVGTSREEALKDAFRAAIRQEVGEVVDSEVKVRNDALIKDEILTYSDGYIPRHEVIKATVEGGMHKVSIRARVERRRLVEKLVALKITVKDIDGASETVKVETDREAREAARAMVTKAFVGFPSDQIEARILESKAVDDEGDHITLAVRLEISPSAGAYQAFQDRLCQRLKDLARLEGEFATTLERHEPDDRDPCRLPRIGQFNHFSESMLRLMPDVDESVDKSGLKPRWPMVFAVATLVSKDHTRIDWRYFVLDGVAGSEILSTANQQATCKLTFLDGSDKPVAVDRFDPCRDRFLVSSGGGQAWEQITWNKYLMKVWYRDMNYSHEKCFRELTEFEPSGTAFSSQQIQEQHKPAVAFVAPVFFGSGYYDNLLYVPKITLTRHVRLTEDEVRPIKKVRCEMTFRKGGER